MAKGVTISVTRESAARLNRRFNEMSKSVQKKIPTLLTEAGMLIQADAKRGAPVRYGVLRSSIYFDNRGNQRKEIGLNPGASRQLLLFPPVESRTDGMDVIVGSIVEYAEKMEANHPTRRGFFQQAAEKHTDRFVKAVDALLAKEVKK